MKNEIQQTVVRFLVFACVMLLLTLTCSKIKGQTFNDTIAYDCMEEYNWSGNWWTSGGTSGFANNTSVSPPAAAYIHGTGGGNSGSEYNWYVLPSIDTLNPSEEHKIRFRLSSPRITSTGPSSGIDANDYIDIQISTDGGLNYYSELQIQGNNNAYWDFNESTVSIIADGSLDVYAPSGGGDRTSTGDGISIIEIIVPIGTTSIAVDVFTRVNASGEEFWLDDFFLLGSGGGSALPIQLSSFEAQQIDQSVQIDFTVESQINNDYYTIWRRKEGGNSEKITTIAGDGNSNITKEYRYVDNNPIPGLSYYCLTQTDYDGFLTGYPAKSVLFRPTSTIDLNIKPNPAVDVINLEVADQDGTYFNHHVKIYNVYGDEVFNKLFIGKDFDINIDISKFKKGSYVVSDKTNKANAVGKFIKK
jgi:hypothetical protein